MLRGLFYITNNIRISLFKQFSYIQTNFMSIGHNTRLYFLLTTKVIEFHYWTFIHFLYFKTFNFASEQNPTSIHSYKFESI